MPERENLQKQLNEVKRRLAVLEIQRASFGGLYAPAHIITEIEDAQKEIAELEERWRAVSPDPSPSSDPNDFATERPEPPPLFRVFLASPGDVPEEQQAVLKVLERFPNRLAFREKVRFQPVAWDAPEVIEAKLPKPSECDIVIVILWSKMGTPFKYNGVEYLSGTHYALLAALSNPQTETLIYQRTEEKLFKASDEDGIAQYKKVQSFLKSAQFDEPTSGQIKRRVNKYSTPAEFKENIETGLAVVITRLLERHPTRSIPPSFDPQVPVIAAKKWEGSPFPGLRSFKKLDAPIFFGRERETDELVRKVTESRFVAVVGTSGSGKSSLVGAGLLPRLEGNAINSETTRSKDWLLPDFERGKDWSGLRFTPGELGDNPFLALAAKLAPLVEATPLELSLKLAQNPQEGIRLLTQALEGKPASAEVLVFIDQFEELFTRAKEDTLGPFCQMLSLLAEHPRMRVVVTIRHDFVHRAIEIPILAEMLNRGFFSLAAPTLQYLAQMLKYPAEIAALEFDGGLPEQILHDTSNEPGALALMAYLLDELYKVAEKRGDRRLSFGDYKALEGVGGAIGKRAEETFNSLRGTEEEKIRLLGRVFRELVEVNDEGKATRRRAPQRHFDPEELTLIEAFTEARLLVKDKEQVEVAHEALFLSWKRLAEWIAERQDDFMLRRQVRNAAAEWKNENYPVYLRWLQERLEPVYAMKERLEWEPDETEEQFIEAEQKWLLREKDNPQTSHQRREEIGYRLGRIGDTRPNLGVGEAGIADIMWLPVMPGGKLKIEKETFEVEPFYIAKYLITYPQYEAFVEAGDGYNNLEWWQGMPEEYQPQKLYNATARFGNYPRDTVTWYQAVAYTRWLSRRLKGLEIANPGNSAGTPYIIGKNAVVRLPTEWEWQWAAQGGQEGRKCPWGEWQEGYANTDEAKLGRTTAVGMYPQGAAKWGAMDMAGNVWEWCLNKYSELKETQVDASGADRVLRGGSFSGNQVDASCVYRGSSTPSHDFSGYGFRVVLGSAPSRPSYL